jgi:hypothetical protein
MADHRNKGVEQAPRTDRVEQVGAEGGAEPMRQAGDAIRQGADQLRNQMSGMAEMSAKVSRELIERSGQNFEVMRRIAETLASGVQTTANECTEYVQHTVQRQTWMMQQLSAAQSPNEVLEIQNHYLNDNLKEILSFTERLSRLSADKAKEAGERLDYQPGERLDY